MKNVFEEINWYALGRKGIKHKIKNGQVKENYNLSNIQNFLSELPNDEYYVKKFKSLLNRQ